MKKSKLLACLAMAGVLAIGAGTYAIFSDKTIEKQNVFTIGSGIDGDILEPNWPGNDGNEVEYTPGEVISKDPQILNNSTKESAYIGIQLRYVLPENAYTLYNKNNGTNYENNNGVLNALGYTNEENYIKALTEGTEFNLAFDKFSAGTVTITEKDENNVEVTKTFEEAEGYWKALGLKNSYMYVGETGEALAVEHGMLTEPIFKEVKIKKDIDIKDMMPFEIRVQGYLVQTSNGIDAVSELTSLMSAK